MKALLSREPCLLSPGGNALKVSPHTLPPLEKPLTLQQAGADSGKAPQATGRLTAGASESSAHIRHGCCSSQEPAGGTDRHVHGSLPAA